MPCRELRMIEKLRYGVHTCIGNLCFVESLHDTRGIKRIEDISDCCVQFLTMCHTRGSRIETRIACQFRPLENNAAESFPLALVLNAEKDRFAIPALKRAIRSDCRVAGAGTCRRFSTIPRKVGGIT